MSDDIQELIKVTKKLRELSRIFARFVIEFGTHKTWCASRSCTCGYVEFFNAAHKFLKETKNDSK